MSRKSTPGVAEMQRPTSKGEEPVSLPYRIPRRPPKVPGRVCWKSNQEGCPIGRSAWHTLTSLPRERAWWLAVDPTKREEVHMLWQKSTRRAKPLQVIVPVTVDHHERLMAIQLLPCQEADRWMCEATDITEALARQRAHQERDHDDLAAQAAVLAETNRRMDEFLGIVSHELRTPLTSLKTGIQISAGYAADLANMAEADPRLARMRHILERGDHQVDRLANLVNDLLDVSRIQAGKLDFRFGEADLVAIVQDALEEGRMAMPGRTLLFENATSHVRLRIDQDRIRQVLANLIGNAHHYSPLEQPITISLAVSDRDVQIAVRDEGPGLDAEAIAQLWERFYRVPGIVSQTGSAVGLGLGLFICRTIIGRHGGKVGIESAPGEGSLFWFTLPLR